VLGALAPDLPLFFFFGWYTFVERVPQAVLWREIYYSGFWQTVMSVSHSFPLWIAAATVAFALRRMRTGFFCAAALLAAVEDILVHAGDGHAHFWPFSEYRFSSPVSYWDPAHHGVAFSVIEALLVTFLAARMHRTLESRWGKALLWISVALLWGNYMMWHAIFTSF